MRAHSSPGSTPSDPTAGFLHLHVAEYEALTMRITYFITIQYVIYGLVGGYLAFAVQASKNLSPITLVWASLLVFQLLAWAFAQTLWEMFVIVDYIEKDLKPKIESLLGTRPFWEWERFLSSRTQNRFVGYERRYGAPILFAVALAVAGARGIHIVRNAPWTLWETAWVLSNIYVLVMWVGKGLDILAIRNPSVWTPTNAFVKSHFLQRLSRPLKRN